MCRDGKKSFDVLINNGFKQFCILFLEYCITPKMYDTYDNWIVYSYTFY